MSELRSASVGRQAEKLASSTGYERLPQKTAVLSHVLPPSPGGQCVVLSHLLERVDPNDYILITHEGLDLHPEDAILRPLPAPYFAVGRSLKLNAGWRRRLGPFAAAVSLVMNVVHRTRRIIRVLGREKCAALVVCSGDPYNLAAAYLATRILRLDLHPYLFDDPVYQWPLGQYRRFSELLSPRLLRSAKSIVVPNEFLRDELRKRYKVESVIVRNPVVVDSVGRAAGFGSSSVSATRATDSGTRRIVYTGVISHAHFDAFRNLIEGLRVLGGRTDGDDPRVRLDVYTATDEAVLRAEGIAGPMSLHPSIAHDQIGAVQSTADILFLPLGFETPIPELIRTSAPGKLGEYLASGRPILVHAPADSFLAWYFRTHRCGLVVDEPSPERLAAAIRRLLDDAALVSDLVNNALARARETFDVRVARDAFRQCLDDEKKRRAADQ